MKRYFTLFFLLIAACPVFAQVAVNANGSSPHSSAMLDISSSNKGLLIPRVYLQSLIDNTTIATPATGLLVYNTNSNLNRGVGFYYNSGTQASPDWQPMQDLILPVNKGTSTDGSAFTIANYSQNTASTAIKAVAGGAGNALEVSGKMKIAGVGQLPAAGKVLTSDASGNASWQGAVAFRAGGAKGGGSETFADMVEKKVAFRAVSYDLSGNYRDAYTSPHSTFTVPVKGIYRFDVRLSWFNAPECRYWIDIRVKRNGGEFVIVDYFQMDEHPYMEFGGDAMLEPGDEVFVVARHDAGSTISLTAWENDWTTSFFSGRLVIKL